MIFNESIRDLSADKIVGGYLLDLESRHSGDPSVDGDSRITNEYKRFWTRRVPVGTVPFGTSQSRTDWFWDGNPSGQNDVLIKLAHSKNLWERRIAIIATYQFIKKKKEYDLTFKIAEILLADKHDLLHKAVGWMLREVGKQYSQEILEGFLKKHYKQMPRTTLRYAIEKYPEERRKQYLSRTI